MVPNVLTQCDTIHIRTEFLIRIYHFDYIQLQIVHKLYYIIIEFHEVNVWESSTRWHLLSLSSLFLPWRSSWFSMSNYVVFYWELPQRAVSWSLTPAHSPYQSTGGNNPLPQFSSPALQEGLLYHVHICCNFKNNIELIGSLTFSTAQPILLVLDWYGFQQYTSTAYFML